MILSISVGCRLDYKMFTLSLYMYINFHKFQIDWAHSFQISWSVRGRSQLSTFMKAYTAYARGEGSGTTVRFSPENQHLILIADNVL